MSDRNPQSHEVPTVTTTATAPQFNAITTGEASALLMRVSQAREATASLASELRRFCDTLQGDSETPQAWLRGELEEALEYVELAEIYLTPDPDNGGCSLDWLSRRLAAAAEVPS